MTESAAAGLEGVVVAETRMSRVDGQRGRLVVAGRDVGQLSGLVPFEAVCGLLWSCSAEAARAAIGRGRLAAWNQLPKLGDALKREDGMAALLAAVAHLRVVGDDPIESSAAVVGALPVFVAAWARRRRGLAAREPDPHASHAVDTLRMNTGSAPSEAEANALDTYLVTVADHGLSASTFAARVVASTGSDLVSAIAAAIGALKGPLHGGAPGPVLDMLDAVGEPRRAREWIEQELRARRRIMGMGHRVYRVRDPRAAVLEAALERLEASLRGDPKAVRARHRVALARAVEAAAETALAARYPDRPLRANVEFYTAVLLDALGLPRALFSPTFACARAAGWCGHVIEQRSGGRLIRPLARYVGDEPPAAS